MPVARAFYVGSRPVFRLYRGATLVFGPAPGGGVVFAATGSAAGQAVTVDTDLPSGQVVAVYDRPREQAASPVHTGATDASGAVSFSEDPGTYAYHVYRVAGGVHTASSSNPVSVTVSA